LTIHIGKESSSRSFSAMATAIAIKGWIYRLKTAFSGFVLCSEGKHRKKR
jgi:hypothetical protein